MPRRLFGNAVATRNEEATPYSDVEMSSNVFERVGMSLYNALRLDPEASVRALLAPDTLPPKKRTTLAREWTQGREGLESYILSTVTNPLVLVGAAMSYRWPILDPSKYRSAAATIKQYERWIPAPLRKILGLNEVFAGTPIPQLAAKIPADADNFLHRHFKQVGDGLMAWRKAMGRKETIADTIRWGILADGTFSPQNLRRLNRLIREANKKLSRGQRLPTLTANDVNVSALPVDSLVLGPYRKAMAGIPRELNRNPTALARMRKHAEKTFGLSPDVEWIKGDYFPRIAVKNFRALSGMRRRLVEGLLADADAVGTSVAETIRRYGKATAKATTPRLAARRNVLPPDVSDLSLLPEGSISQRALHSLGGLRERNMLAQRPPSYSLRFSSTLGTYAHSLSRAYSWSFKGHGDKLVKEAGKVLTLELKAGRGTGKSELLKNVFIPQLLGTTKFDDAIKALEYAGIRQVAWKMVADPKAMRGVPEFARKGMMALLLEDGFWSPAVAGSRISNYFYTSTLGANLSSAAQNLFQPIITTGPLIGMGPTLRGMAKVIGKIPEYAKLRLGGMDERSALERLFPNFVKSGGELGALTTEALRESADIAKGGILGAKTKGLKLREALLAPFRSSELFNRLSAFEAATEQATRFGLKGAGAISHATDVVNLTQMWAGGASTPAFMADWWGPFRQFLTFPTKVAGFGLGSITPTITSAGMELGIGGSFNPGVLGRALVASAAAYQGAKEFADADISRSLLFGGLPLPQEQAVLSPLPVLPPIISLGAGAVQDLVTGRAENIKRSAPLLVPGGVQAAKLSQVYVPRIAKLLGRGYADTEQTGPDGMVPMFDNRGNLVGHKDSFDLLMGTIGIPGRLLGPNGDVQVREVERYLLGQRDTIRDIRAAFIESYLDGDMLAAERLQSKYLADYGHPIQVRQQDWDAAGMRRFIPRMERIAKTLPADVRSRFLQVAHTALSGSGERFLGADPRLFSLPRKQIGQLLQPRGVSYGQ